MCQKITVSLEEYCRCGCDLWFDLGIGEHYFELDSGGGFEEGVDFRSGSSRAIKRFLGFLMETHMAMVCYKDGSSLQVPYVIYWVIYLGYK